MPHVGPLLTDFLTGGLTAGKLLYTGGELAFPGGEAPLPLLERYVSAKPDWDGVEDATS